VRCNLVRRPTGTDRLHKRASGGLCPATGGYGPFRGLAQLQAGDEVLVYLGDQEVYVYKVNSVKTEGH
jgi:hypothetical protein